MIAQYDGVTQCLVLPRNLNAAWLLHRDESGDDEMTHEQIPEIPEDPSLTYSPERTRVLSNEETRPSGPVTVRHIRTSQWNVKKLDSPSGDKDKHGAETQTGSGGSLKIAPEVSEKPEYTLRRLIGKGGFGEVWEAKQGSLDRLVAIKRIKSARRRPGKRNESEELFRQEAATTAYLEHPNIVPIHDLGTDATGSPMLAMKLVRGRPWDEELRDEFHRLSSADFLSKHVPVLLEVCQAVAFAHSRGIIHRDIKPSQVMIGSFGEVLLMDWGLAVWKEPDDPLINEVDLDDEASWIQRNEKPQTPPQIPTLESASNPAGTPALMAPEQALATANGIDFRTDVYLLGGTLYCLLTGRFPHQSKTSRESMKLALSGKIVPPEEVVPERTVPRELSLLCMKALERNPENRVPTVLDFAESLGDFLSGASRRRDSVRFTDELLEELTRPSRTYEDLERDLGRLERSAALWPDNPSLPVLMERVLDEFARVALERGDLHLARYHANRMGMGRDRLELMSKLEEREEEISAKSRQRKLAIGAFAILVCIFFLGMLVFTGSVAAERNRAQEALASRGATELAMREREKELTCFHAVAEALQTQGEIAGLLKESVSAFPPAWQYPDMTVARIVFGDQVFESENYKSPVFVQTAPLIVKGEKMGQLEVGYTTDQPEEDEGPFLAQERQLIDSVAKFLSEGIERRLVSD